VLWDLELGELVKAELADEPKVFCPLSFFSAPFLCCAGANPKPKPNTNKHKTTTENTSDDQMKTADVTSCHLKTSMNPARQHQNQNTRQSQHQLQIGPRNQSAPQAMMPCHVVSRHAVHNRARVQP
jgi:hypothetical protein